MVPGISDVIRVAYADDHRTVLETISMFINQQDDIRVTLKAVSGRQLLEKMQSTEELPHVCLVDIAMHDMNGFETVPLIRERWPDIRIIILTGYLKDEYLERMVQLEVHSYVSKDNHPDEIIRAIRAVINEGVYYNKYYNLQLIRAIRNNTLFLPELTELEKRILKLIVEDKSYQEIADALHLTIKSVEGHKSKMGAKLGVSSKVGLALYALKYGYVDAIPPLRRDA